MYMAFLIEIIQKPIEVEEMWGLIMDIEIEKDQMTRVIFHNTPISYFNAYHTFFKPLSTKPIGIGLSNVNGALFLRGITQ
jgi:hypothetical protein